MNDDTKEPEKTSRGRATSSFYSVAALDISGVALVNGGFSGAGSSDRNCSSSRRVFSASSTAVGEGCGDRKNGESEENVEDNFGDIEHCVSDRRELLPGLG